MSTTSVYEPIADLPADWQQLALDELRALDDVWQEQRDRLEALDELKTFRTRLVRSWAIETGVIERVYTIDRGVTDLLITEGLKQSLLVSGTDRDPAEVMAILQDHQEAVDMLFDYVGRSRELTVGFVKELHALLTRNQASTKGVDQFGRVIETELLRGEWKQRPNNPRRPDGQVHVYAPPEQVASEMDRLIYLHEEHIAKAVPPEVEAAWLHHRFTQIHPFQDGNGRVARALASLIYIRAGWFPLSIHRDRRVSYIDALEQADDGSLAPIVHLFGLVARDALVRALAVGDQSEQDLTGIRQVVAAARDRMLGTAADTTQEELRRSQDLADGLRQSGVAQLEQLKEVIDKDIAGIRPNFSCQVEDAPYGDPRVNWYRSALIRFAQDELHYFANVKTYASWVRMRLNDFEAGTRHDIVFSLHAMGHVFRGLIAGVAFYERADTSEEGGHMMTTDRRLIQPDIFQLNHREQLPDVQQRFSDWMTDSTTVGLTMWEHDLGGS